MKKISAILITIIFLATITIGKSYYDDKVKADVQKAHSSSQVEEKKHKEEVKGKVNASKKEISERISPEIRNELNLIPFKTKAIEKLDKGQKATIVFLGDSTTEQNFQTNGKPGHVSIINDFLKNTYGSDIVKVVNSGVSGNTIIDMSARIDKIISINPDIVVINSGLNDAGRKISNEDFETKYKWVIEQIQQKTNAQILLRTSNKVMESDSVNKRLETDINPIVKKLSDENKTGFVDLYSYYSYQITNLGVPFKSINNDNFHPNEKGQQIIADLLLYTLLGGN
ncbi:SGNH/GDSL hydrolase family protein [Bacillus thuringiensis]|uniref:SGNH/GDSL hydrolase family protein n=1 Tax=Bacillus thuringiensis TaxID=1428 RepID=A0A9W3VH43_BACTU|nr:GDSL-type esterase/lipase family protein [Bacillus thuringiensis]AMR06356.1 hypothetical protein AXW78_29075 [Bacillus thuringiensis]AYF85133.1 SGNH/GDSL hydrolase family protein [Bacillus thuringiensis]PNK35465.1 hypothetical protein CBR55_25065 [Bacillus thuringiensis]